MLIIAILVALICWNAACFVWAEQWRRELAAAQQRKQVQP